MADGTETEFNPESALVYRRVFAIDQGRVVVEEKWDKTHPHCPFIENPWNPYGGSLNEWGGIRQVVMSAEGYTAAKISLKDHSHTEPT